MYLKIRVLLLLLISSLTFFSCSDDPASIGGDTLPGEDFIDLLEVNPDSVQQTSRYLQNKVNLSTADRVVLGRANNLQSSILLRFLLNTMHDTIETQFKNNELNILSARVEMTPTYSLGAAGQTFDFGVYKIENSWSTGVNADSIATKLIIGNTDLASNKDLNDSLHSFTLDFNLVKNWLLAEADTSRPDEYGIYLKPTDNTQKAFGYQAITSSGIYPLMSLDVIIQKKDGTYTDTLIFGPTLDVHVVSEITSSPVQNDALVMKAGLAQSAVMNLTTPQLPPYTTINRALLQLTVDEQRTNLGTPTTDSVIVRFLTGTLDTGVHFDSTQIVLMKRSGTKYEGDIATYVQRWHDGETNNGIVLYLFNQAYSLDQLTVYGSNAANPADKPKLYITYTSKK